jgi:hypothetical protein
MLDFEDDWSYYMALRQGQKFSGALLQSKVWSLYYLCFHSRYFPETQHL